ncbi:MCE family protein [Altererythrobacter sp. RZ02]|uniref:MCE family protein n=1 Tax=Pontixanthobacter rizhaonensis TaxID=2730337 RepID=A0A848QKK3_9SPHN|nr:MlaD family protein [Pontixanthobacter rizhaonensis]NMW30715.1 MCE family protein [Pontixanthobacter rizhaonensis]
METRANHLWVGAVTLVLLAALAAGIVWLAQLGQGQQKQYDILFGQDVSGLATGSQVSFAGVPVGQVSDIKLYEENLEFVRVRIKVESDIPILIGTTATIQGSFTGVSTILLEGARNGAPPITCETTACFEADIPQIPPKSGGLGALLSSAPVLLERLATLTERMTLLLSDKNQRQLEAILENTNKVTAGYAESGPQFTRTMAELEGTLAEASEALDAFEKVTNSTDNLLNQEGAALAKELRGTLASANKAATALTTTLEDTQPATRQLVTKTLPAAEATLEDLRATSKALRNVTERIENEGAGSLLGAPSLPEYEP